jgi:hypothetical protein
VVSLKCLLLPSPWCRKAFRVCGGLDFPPGFPLSRQLPCQLVRLKKETLIYSEHTTRHFLFHPAEITRDQKWSAKQKSRAANEVMKAVTQLFKLFLYLFRLDSFQHTCDAVTESAVPRMEANGDHREQFPNSSLIYLDLLC